MPGPETKKPRWHEYLSLFVRSIALATSDQAQLTIKGSSGRPLQ